MYVNSIDDVTVLKQFLESMANHRFCSLNKDSKCGIVCEPFDPISQVSPNVCKTMGVDAMVNVSQSLDTGLYNPVKLSPVYMGGCMKNCDKIQPSDIKEDDYSINYCLQFGFCGETLNNICKVANEKGQTLQNPLLKQYCELKFKPIDKTDKSNENKKINTPPPPPNSHKKNSLKSTKEELKSNDEPYTNNMGVFSVIIVIILLSLFILGNNRRR